jgi:flagellar motor switch protein FliM
LTIPDTVSANVDGVPVMECSYGKLNGQYALRVEKLLTQETSEFQGDQHV